MKIRHLLPGLLLVLGPTAGADPAKGKELVDTNCYSCHGNEIYTRPDRKVQTLDGLHKQVQRCELALGLKWFDEDIKSSAAHLNQSFYHFK